MAPSRRDFLLSAAALSSAALARGGIPDAIARAMAIDPERGSTFHDAEHIVVLMQENRSFDHCFGALQGVRGFRDPRVHAQPDGRPVWFQTDAAGATYAPFRLDITKSNATWIGGLPHDWPDQVDARNGGKYDKWLIAKPKRDLPFTLGHYQRDDLPFYYALADAFTVCDQAFCSSLTGTTPNRLFLWTGNIRSSAVDPARVTNGDTDYEHEASWRTFPERLEDAGVSWRIYQNEISLDSGLTDDEDAWLANFTDAPLEWFSQYQVRFGKSHRVWLPKLIEALPARIAAAEAKAAEAGLAAAEATKRRKEVVSLKAALDSARVEITRYTDVSWEQLSPRERSLHEKAFTTNAGDPKYRELTTLQYDDQGTTREVQVPAGDTLHQFRQDVAKGELPAISWLIAPENFSDHPGAPWYGAWYVSEVLDILTKNPDVWKKTIFVLCYDENDGYFDHVPPFTAPHPDRPETGKTSSAINTAIDWANVHGRDNSIGLGYRVPMVIASPWSRGGCVNSQVVDHTSVLQLMETWLEGKGKSVREENISPWRRTVCGDLSSVFRPWNGEPIVFPTPIDRDATVERIYSARFRDPAVAPAPSRPDADSAQVASQQEPGVRPSCPLPYDLHVNAVREGDTVTLTMSAGNAFGKKSQGAPFNGYRYGVEMQCRAYAVSAGDTLHDSWPAAGGYQLRIDGPNGFMREFSDGDAPSPLQLLVEYRNGKTSNGELTLRLSNHGASPEAVVVDGVGAGSPYRIIVRPGGKASMRVPTAATHGWYDFTVRAGALRYRYAGRVERGGWSITDPAMG